MSFLSDLGSLGSSLLSDLSSAMGFNENSPGSLDTEALGDFGRLGDFAKQIDRSAQRSYVETGYIRNIKPRQAEILLSEPNLTVVLKKRMFASLVENFKPELMDSSEKLFYRASKKLFQNKCKVISTYEQLTKLERIAVNQGVMNDYLFPVVLGGLDVLSSFGVDIVDAKTKSIMETLRKVKTLSDPNFSTTWVLDREIPALSDLGEGPGIIELTLVSNLNCTVSTLLGNGSASLTLEDPYKLMLMTEDDIEKALRESSNGVLNAGFFRLTETELENTISNLRTQLNQVRVARGATGIRFFVNEDSLLFKKVRAVIDEEGREIIFSIDGALGFSLDGGGLSTGIDVDPSSMEGTNGLKSDNDELELFKQVIRNIYLLQGIRKNTESTTIEFNKETNAVRAMMMLHYANKPIIQPMDSLHVYVSSKTEADPKTVAVINSTLNGGQIFDAIDDTIANLNATLDNIESTLNGGTSKYGGYATIEKDAIAGPDFPMWLWNIMRNDFTQQGAGTHIFAGIIQESNHSYSAAAGKYTLTASASDNAGYFNMGIINVNPSTEVFNGPLYDPLTSRELEFDVSSGFLRGEESPLLEENIQLLNSGLIKFKNGILRGTPANQQTHQGLNIERIMNSNGVRRRYEDPDGFVYRWKRGIQSLTNLGAPHPTGAFRSETSPTLTKNPFAGQDVMNVLSLLVSGQPYNFNTFMQAAISSGSISRDDLLNEDSSKSYFRGLLSDINKQNATWGNFIPFKKLIINESAYQFLRRGQLDATTINRRITELLQERARRFDELVKAAPEFANNPQYLNVDSKGRPATIEAQLGTIVSSPFADTTIISKLGKDIIKLDFDIEQAKSKFYDSLTKSNLNNNDGSIRIFGDDISYDPNITQSSSGLSEEDRIKERSEFRKKVNYLTQRRLWRVKANEDPNLLIVDDSYDKNYDIQAFSKALTDLELFNSNYHTVKEQIEGVANILGLEIFADSQGHIQIRPPQYNRVPSSVFYKMIEKKDTTGIRIFPAYLESLFLNQIDGLTNRLEIIEDEIRIRAAVLGYPTDSQASSMLLGGNSMLSAQGAAGFAFVTDPDTGLFGGKDIRSVLDQANPDLLEERLRVLDSKLNGAIKSNINFDILQRTNIVNNKAFTTGLDATINERIGKIGARLGEKTGQAPPTQSTLLSVDSLGENRGKKQLDILNISQQIATFLSERQSLIKLLANAIKNLNQGAEINNSKEPGRSLLTPFLSKQKSFPEILEHMIEDEDFDDFGAGSGKRYVIKDNQILSFRVTEKPPPFTMVEVNGLYAEGLAEPGQGFELGGGNAISTAWAVDFDMWRMYGSRGVNSFSVPFLSNADTQCAPYAVFLLNKARRNIFQGELNMVGNEFIQAGEVYYIEDYNMLFYAESVSHDFSYGSGGGSYTTSLSLKYGHNPGEYLPTILDIVGKSLYVNKHQADLVRNSRHGNASGDVPVNVLVFENRPGQFDLDPEPIKALMQGSYGEINRKNLSNLLLAAGGLLSPTKFGKVATVELRVHSNSSKGFSTNSTLLNLASSIKDWMLNPSSAVPTEDGSLLPDTKVDEVNSLMIPDEKRIQIVEVDLGKLDEHRSPSSNAWNKAREIYSTSGSAANFSDLPPGSMELFNNVVDVWVTFETSETTNEVPRTPEDPTDQSAIDNLNKTLEAFAAKIKSQS